MLKNQGFTISNFLVELDEVGRIFSFLVELEN